MKNQRRIEREIKKEIATFDTSDTSVISLIWIIARIDFLAVVIIGFPLAIIYGGSHGIALSTSLLLTTVNVWIGYYFTVHYLHADMNSFVSMVYGSMFLRLAGLCAAILLLLIFSNFPQITFILSLFISYIYKSVLEIIFINKISTQRHR